MDTQHDDGQFLLPSVNELTALLEKKGSIHEFLVDLVEMVSRQMASPVCSVYLYDAGRCKLVLRATKGLNPELVDRLALEVGEGITGHAFQHSHSVRVERASEHLYFHPVPNSAEEQFASFLAVPIRRGSQAIGIITLEHEKADYFTPQDSNSLKAIASQLANILEDAEFLLELYQDHKADIEGLPPIVKGMCVGAGVYIGQSVVFSRRSGSFQQMRWGSETPASPPGLATTVPHPPPTGAARKTNLTDELTLFAKSLRITKEQLEDIQRSLGNSIAEAADIIFSAHMLMLRDVNFSDAMQHEIKKGNTAEEAITTVVNHYVELFSAQPNPRMQEKTQDVLDLGHRLIKNIHNKGKHARQDFAGQIIVAEEIFPSEIIKFVAGEAEGLVVLGGGETAHSTFLAKSLNFPVIFVQEAALLNVADNTPLLIDADAGRLLINPSPHVLKDYKPASKKRPRKQLVSINIPERCRTSNGHLVTILANVNLVQDVTYALDQKAEGIGLYRSEFPFLVRNDFPSEEEQKAIYEQVIEPMGEREVVIRTLDIGGDKFIGHYAGQQEANPFLGYRGIRFSLKNADIFLEQIRAILRAGRKRNIGILFPMIGSIEEFIDARDMVYRSMEELQRDGIPFCETPRIGAMIELPSAAEIAGELAEASDFLSLGTNDLIMYLLAVDRTNVKVADLYKPWHPAVLRVLDRISGDVGEHITNLSVCGEAGSNPALIPFLLGRGIQKLSVSPQKIPDVKNYVGSITNKGAEKIARDMLSLRRLRDIEAYLREEVLKDEGGSFPA